MRFADAPAAEDVLNSVGGPGGTRNIDGRDVKINYAHNKAGRSDNTYWLHRSATHSFIPVKIFINGTE